MGSYSKVSKSTYVYLGHAWTLSKKRDTQVFMHPAMLYYCNTHCIIIVIYCNIIVIHSELHTGVYAPISNHFISQTESRHTGVEDSGSCRYIQQQNAAYWNLQSVESTWSYDLTWVGSIDDSKIEMGVLFLLYLIFVFSIGFGDGPIFCLALLPQWYWYHSQQWPLLTRNFSAGEFNRGSCHPAIVVSVSVMTLRVAAHDSISPPT